MEIKTSPQEPARIELRELLGIGILVVVLVMVVAFGANIVSDVQSDFTADTTEYNATTDGLAALGKITSKITKSI